MHLMFRPRLRGAMNSGIPARIAAAAAVLVALAAAALASLQPASAYYITPLHLDITFPGSEGIVTAEDVVTARIALGFDITPEAEGVRWEQIAAPRIGHGEGRVLRPDLIDRGESWIELSGGLKFAQTGSDRIEIAGLRGSSVQGDPRAIRDDLAYLDCDHGATAASGGSTRGECIVTIGRGAELPRVAVVDSLYEGSYVLSARIGMAGDNSFRGLFTHDGRLSTLGGERLYQARAVIGVGKVHYVSTVELRTSSPGPGGIPQWPSRIDIGGNSETRLTLRIRNADGDPTDARVLRLISLKTDLGWFEDSRCVVRKSRVCTFTERALGNLGRSGAGDIRDIRLVSSPAVSITNVTATVVAREGGVYQSLPVVVSYVGPAASLEMSPADTVVSDRPLPHSDADTLTFTIEAFDAASRPTELPEELDLAIHDTYGIRVSRDRVVASRRGDQVQLYVVGNLHPGAYGITAQYRGMAATSTFTVAGAPHKVEVLERSDSTLRIGDQVTILARVTDSLGSPVIDGTQVDIDQVKSSRPTLIPGNRGPAGTVGGVAEMIFAIVGDAPTTVVATSGTAEGRRPFTLPQPRPAAQPEPRVQEAEADPAAAAPASDVALAEADAPEVQAPVPPEVDSVRLDSRSTWGGSTIVTAAELLALLGAPDAVIYIWNGAGWLAYGETAGTAVPGSVNFDIRPGNVIWVSSPA